MPHRVVRREFGSGLASTSNGTLMKGRADYMITHLIYGRDSLSKASLYTSVVQIYLPKYGQLAEFFTHSPGSVKMEMKAWNAFKIIFQKFVRHFHSSSFQASYVARKHHFKTLQSHLQNLHHHHPKRKRLGLAPIIKALLVKVDIHNSY